MCASRRAARPRTWGTRHVEGARPEAHTHLGDDDEEQLGIVGSGAARASAPRAWRK